MKPRYKQYSASARHELVKRPLPVRMGRNTFASRDAIAIGQTNTRETTFHYQPKTIGPFCAGYLYPADFYCAISSAGGPPGGGKLKLRDLCRSAIKIYGKKIVLKLNFKLFGAN